MEKYTQQEVDSKINVLTTSLEDLKLKRTELSQQINNTKKQILYWEELDKSQLKLF